MIVRMWHGRVPTSKAAAYREFVNARAIPDYQSVEGNISVHILERSEGDIHHTHILERQRLYQSLCWRGCGSCEILP